MQSRYELKQILTPIGSGKDDDQQPEPGFSPDNGAHPHIPGSKITDQQKKNEAGEQGSGFGVSFTSSPVPFSLRRRGAGVEVTYQLSIIHYQLSPICFVC